MTKSLGSPNNPESQLLVRPAVAWRMLDVGNTHGYQLLAAGELESFLDGAARKITVESIHRFIERKLAASVGKSVTPRRRKTGSHSPGANQGRVAA
jgi:hypothetical protein